MHLQLVTIHTYIHVFTFLHGTYVSNYFVPFVSVFSHLAASVKDRPMVLSKTDQWCCHRGNSPLELRSMMPPSGVNGPPAALRLLHGSSLHSCICTASFNPRPQRAIVGSVRSSYNTSAHDCQVSLVALFGVSTALMRASSLKQMFRQNTNCFHTWLIWVGHLQLHCNLLELKCTMLCEALPKME